MKKVILVVLDGFGVGEAPDAKAFGDIGSNTFVNTNNVNAFNIPTLEKLGLKKIDGLPFDYKEKVIGNYGKLQELSMGKDTITGHFEMAGSVNKKPFPTFTENGFDEKIVTKLENIYGTGILGNEAASGTEIMKRLGKEHLKTKKPIIYTSADSVLQIMAHEDVWNIETLYDMCEKTRKVMKGKYGVARVIARPFATNKDGEFYRTKHRKDFSLKPKHKTMLVSLSKKGCDVVGVGKIEDIFSMQGITETYHTQENKTSILKLKELMKKDINGLIFVNLIDTDMLYGHRNDPKGYKESIDKSDKALDEVMKMMDKDDILIVTGDHGCDPVTISTDHSREYVPFLVYGKNLKQDVNLGTLKGFDNISKLILEYFNLGKKSVLKDIK